MSAPRKITEATGLWLWAEPNDLGTEQRTGITKELAVNTIATSNTYGGTTSDLNPGDIIIYADLWGVWGIFTDCWIPTSVGWRQLCKDSSYKTIRLMWPITDYNILERTEVIDRIYFQWETFPLPNKTQKNRFSFLSELCGASVNNDAYCIVSSAYVYKLFGSELNPLHLLRNTIET